VDRLYAEAPDQFTGKRNALAKRLRADGDKASAQEVAKLKKPTVAAGLVNHLAHNEAKAMERFSAAASDLQEAQDEAVSGQGGEHLRKASRAGRDAIEGLVQVARRVGNGGSEATFDRVRETLEAALADPKAREEVGRGRLAKELRPGESIPRTVGPKKSSARIDRKVAAAERELCALRKKLKASEADELRLQNEKGRAEQLLADARASLRDARGETRKLRSELRLAEKRLEGR
jgi:hypothetical protein